MKNYFLSFLFLVTSCMMFAQDRCTNDSLVRENPFIEQFPTIENKIRKLYESYVFSTSKNPDFKISEICTPDFIQRLKDAGDYDDRGYATWLLRSGMQDGDNTISKVISVVPKKDNIIIVNWIDMGHIGSTTFTLIESDGQWKINHATVPSGFQDL